MASSVAELRSLLDERFPDAVPVRYGTTGVSATGIGALDAVLPAGGLPRGRVTLWSPGGGATAVLRSACEAAVGRGERAAWVDGWRSTVGTYWRSGPVLLRPVDREEALTCAEVLLRSGGFAIVVLTGCDEGDGLAESPGVRLSRAVRDGGGVFVAVSRGAPVAHLKARSRISPGGYHWRTGPFGEPVVVAAVTVEARLEASGLSRQTRFTIPVRNHDVRMSLEPELVDRRGVDPSATPPPPPDWWTRVPSTTPLPDWGTGRRGGRGGVARPASRRGGRLRGTG